MNARALGSGGFAEERWAEAVPETLGCCWSGVVTCAVVARRHALGRPREMRGQWADAKNDLRWERGVRVRQCCGWPFWGMRALWLTGSAVQALNDWQRGSGGSTGPESHLHLLQVCLGSVLGRRERPPMPCPRLVLCSQGTRRCGLARRPRALHLARAGPSRRCDGADVCVARDNLSGRDWHESQMQCRVMRAWAIAPDAPSSSSPSTSGSNTTSSSFFFREDLVTRTSARASLPSGENSSILQVHNRAIELLDAQRACIPS